MSAGRPAEATPFADPTDTLLGWASRSELTFGEAMAAHPWFPAAGYTDDQLERTERLYGTFLARQVAAGAELSDLLGVTPSLACATLIARAGRLREPDALAGEYVAGLGLEGTEGQEKLIAEFADGLPARVGLEAPESATPTEVLTLHAGVTAAEVPGLIEILDAASPAADADAGALVTDLAERAEELPLTAAVMRIAPERGRELIAGIEAVRAFSLAHPTSWLDRDRSGLEPALPRRVELAVVAELRERPVGTPERATAVGVAPRELRPRLIFDAVRDRVCLRLPEQRVAAAPGADDAEPQVTWRVTQGGTTRVFRTQRPWGEEVYAEALDVAVEQPVREVTVADTTNGITWVVDVVDGEDPALIFAANGQDITDKASLHHSRMTVLVPADARLVDVVTGEDLPVTDSGEIQGWAGWEHRVIDASQAASLQVVRAGKEPSAMLPLRSVDPRQRVRFVHPAEPVAGLRTHNRLPVNPAGLIAEFPPTLSGSDEIWQLSISAYAGVGEPAEEIAEPEPLEVPAEGGEFAVFDPEAYDSPWVGEYLVRLKGPRNESFRHRYAVVEGLGLHGEVEGETAVRIPAGAGLSVVHGRITCGEKEFTAEPAEPVVPATEAGCEIVFATADGDRLPLIWAPEALRFELVLTTEPPQWRTSRIWLNSREVDPAGRLRVRAGRGLKDVKVTVRNRHGSPVRTETLELEDPVTYSTATAGIAHAVAVMPEGRIDLEWTDPAAGRRISVALARVSSVPHATSVTVEDGELVFADLAADRDLAAWVWPATAPWAPARTVGNLAERTALPEGIVGAGELTVQLHSADPFSALRAPERPAAGALTAEQDGYLTDQSEALTALSAFFSGATEEPPAGGEVLPVIWDHFGATPREREVARSVFQAEPARALLALSASLVPAHLQPGRMISSGLVTLPMTGGEEVSEPGRHRSAWISTMLTLGELSEAIGEGAAGHDTVRGLLSRLEELAGHRLVETVLTGRDATLDTAVIDSSTVRISHMDPAQQEQLIKMFFASADIVPGPAMDDGQRLMAVFETFRRRDELTEIVASEGLIKPAVSLLRAVRGANRGLYSAARVRFDKIDGVNTEDRANAWALAPVVSLVFALAARLHAHEMLGKSAKLDQAAEGWAQLADVVPDLVTGDLVSAEAIVIAAKAARAAR